MKLLLRLLTFLAPFRWRVALAILLGSVMIASNVGLLGMAAYLIAAAALGPFLFTLTIPIYIVQIASVTRSVSRYAERMVAHNATFRLLANLRTWFYSRLEPLAPAYPFPFRSGDLLTRLVSDVEELQNLYLRVVSPIIVAIVIGIFTFALFAIFSPLLAWTAVAFLAATGLGVPWLSSTLSRGLGQQQLAIRAELNAQLVDGIQGMQDLLAYGCADDQQRKIAALDRTLQRIQRRMARIAGLQEALNDAMLNLAMWTILILAIPLVTTKAIDGVYLGFLVLVILASFEAVQPLGQAFQFLGHSLAASERLFAVADATPLVAGPASPLPAPDAHASEGHSLRFEQIHFAYRPNEAEILHGIDFDVRPGQRIAIVGPSGSGKSTLVRLALRFWDPTQGCVRLDGQDVRQYALQDLRQLISVVAQDTYLFNDTIRGNLLVQPDTDASAIERALEQAQLGDFVQQLPKGLDTWVGEQGLRLSGGERQRLAIARALLKDAPLLIMDEATANLDPLTEQALLAALDELMRDRTTLLITHRLVAMERMDEILVLNQGFIKERGTHEHLLKQGGLYQQMFEMQSGILAL